ncbi:MAG: hypothetical protein AB7S56_07505 [Halothiobacillaceae bacterium]
MPKLKYFIALLPCLMFGSAHAESSYGYSAAGTASVSAQARLEINVNVPLLVLLRVGSSGSTIDTLLIRSSLTIPGSTGALTDGDNQVRSWNGNPPGVSLNAAAQRRVRAYAWTNASGGGRLSRVSAFEASPNPPAGLTLNMVRANTGSLGGCVLRHPGTNLAATTTQTFARNSLCSANWTFSITAANLRTLGAGETLIKSTYTATTL